MPEQIEIQQTNGEAKRSFWRVKLILLIIGLLLLEVVSYFACRQLVRYGVLYRPVLVSAHDYLSRRDPVLGWPSPQDIPGKKFDAIGSRPIPAYPDPQATPLVSLYGDSFTYSDQVDHEHAWSNVLSKLMGGRVNNFGVGGYGSDQAYLRFLNNKHDDAPVVILTHLSENILRNCNTLRDLLYPGEGTGFTPRFVAEDDGTLRLVPLAQMTEETYVDFMLHPEQHLTDEYFAPGGPAGVSRMSFPYTLSALRSLRHFHIHASLKGEPWYADFYRKEHPARGLQVTAGILQKFAQDAKAKGKTPIVMVLPTGLDIVYFRKTGVWVAQPLVDELNVRGVDTIDPAAALDAAFTGDDLAAYYAHHTTGGHFNEAGYATLAKVVFDELQKRHLVVGRTVDNP